VSLPVIWSPLQKWLRESLSPQEQARIVAVLGVLAGIFGLATLTGVNRRFNAVLDKLNSEAIGSLAEWIGALGTNSDRHPCCLHCLATVCNF
jgi:hypothetical protein